MKVHYRALLALVAGVSCIFGLPARASSADAQDDAFKIVEKKVSDLPCNGCQEILGAYPGLACESYMPPDNFYQSDYTRTQISRTHQRETVVSTDYVTDLTFEQKADTFTDTIKIKCTFPTMGRSIFSVVRQIRYRGMEQAVDKREFMASLAQKYGKPIGEVTHVDKSIHIAFIKNATKVMFSFGANTDPPSEDALAYARKEGITNALYVTLWPCPSEATRLCGVDFVGMNFPLIEQSQQAEAQTTAVIQKLAEDKYAQRLKANPGAAPRL